MAVMDEFKEQREALKNGTPKEKLSYFWYYYKWHVIVTIAVIVALVTFVNQILNRKDVVFYAVMLNATALDTAEAFNGQYVDYAGIDPDTSECTFDTSIRIAADGSIDETSYTSTEKLMVYMAAGELDVMVTDSDSLQKYANSTSFFDLRDILSDEQIAEYEPYFYYVDREVVEALEAAQNNLEDYTADFGDPRKPEEMADPVPVAIYVDECAALKDNYYFRGDDVALGVYLNTSHLDAAVKYIDFLMEQ